MIKTVVKTMLICLAIVLLGSRPVVAAPTPASEYEVKAAFLYNFIKFVEWPPKAFPAQNSPIIIGVLADDDPFWDPGLRVNLLDHAVDGKIINDRKIVVQHSSRIADLRNCQLLFISKSERNRLKEVFASIHGMNILTVGETENFCQSGGAINFIMHEGKVRFEINVTAAEKAGLKISSKLLNVAKIVPTEKR